MDERFFARDVVAVAADLLVARLLVDGIGVLIVETGAYRQADEASHSFRGQTAGIAAMFGEPGRVYIYRSYGLHWCFNIVCERGSAVLIRALEPTHGLETMMERRAIGEARKLCAGPGTLCKEPALHRELNGLSVLAAPFSPPPPS